MITTASVRTGRRGRIRRPRSRGGFTLVEVVVSVAVAALGIGGIVWGYIMAANRAEWSLCAAAAQEVAARRMEQVRSARWDPGFIDELPVGVTTDAPVPLDIPLTSAAIVNATTTVTISTNAASPGLKAIRVDCVWSLMGRGPFTNSISTCRAID